MGGRGARDDGGVGMGRGDAVTLPVVAVDEGDDRDTAIIADVCTSSFATNTGDVCTAACIRGGESGPVTLTRVLDKGGAEGDAASVVTG